MTVRMTEDELRKLVLTDLDDKASAQAWERLRALARRPIASQAVCEDSSDLGRAVLAARAARPGAG